MYTVLYRFLYVYSLYSQIQLYMYTVYRVLYRFNCTCTQSIQSCTNTNCTCTCTQSSNCTCTCTQLYMYMYTVYTVLYRFQLYMYMVYTVLNGTVNRFQLYIYTVWFKDYNNSNNWWAVEFFKHTHTHTHHTHTHTHLCGFESGKTHHFLNFLFIVWKEKGYLKSSITQFATNHSVPLPKKILVSNTLVCNHHLDFCREKEKDMNVCQHYHKCIPNNVMWE